MKALAPSTAFAAALLATFPAHAAYGDPDPSFKTAAFEGLLCRNSPTLLSNDSMLVHLKDLRAADPEHRHIIAKLNKDGTLDRGYGQDGIAKFDVPNRGENLLPLGDGRVLLFGRTATMLLPDGRVDTSYGSAGTTEEFFPASPAGATQLPDGTLMVASVNSTNELHFAWLTAQGQRAEEYGSAGRLAAPFPLDEIVYAWSLQADGSVEVASYKSGGKGVPTPMLRRVRAGSMFASTIVSVVPGVMPAPAIASWTSNAAKVDGFGGVILASGERGDTSEQSLVRLSRFGPDGRIDSAFGSGGSATATTIVHELGSRVAETPSALWAVPGGGWTLVVDAFRSTGVGFGTRETRDKRLLRFTASGGVDDRFPQGKRLDNAPLSQRDDGTLLTARSTSSATSSFICIVSRLVADVPRVEATVVEYFHPALNHYFMTIEGLEVGILDDNRATMGWLRTGKRFGAWAAAAVPGTARLCRFYGDLSAGPNSHFYIPQGAGCDGLRQLEAQAPIGNEAWRLEGLVFSSAEAAGGHCPGALAPVYRFYNRGYEQGKDSNHRYSTDLGVTAEMTAKGWALEGVAFCAPPVSERQQITGF